LEDVYHVGVHACLGEFSFLHLGLGVRSPTLWDSHPPLLHLLFNFLALTSFGTLSESLSEIRLTLLDLQHRPLPHGRPANTSRPHLIYENLPQSTTCLHSTSRVRITPLLDPRFANRDTKTRSWSVFLTRLRVTARHRTLCLPSIGLQPRSIRQISVSGVP